jgi:DNA polymerase eta
MLPVDKQRVEKASIDEVFLDLSAQVHGILLERYPELHGPPPYDDPTEPLPRPPTTALNWKADALIDLDGTHSEEDDPDWDDIAMLIASEIVRDVRAQIYKELNYTCSAGLSRNKMLAKLGSAQKKPNAQTVIRNRAVQHFLSGFKYTKIRNLGGKLGEMIVAAFNTDSVSDLLQVPLEQLKKQLGDDTGSWLYNVLRGEDNSEVNPRTQIKSMLSAKSFRPSINNFETACKWLRIFVADVFSRLVEEGVLENKRRPKTISLHHRQGTQTRSKSTSIPLGRTITEDVLFDLAKNMLAQVVVDGRAWPCSNLSLSVGGFEEGVTGNMGINSFLLRGEDAKAIHAANMSRENSLDQGRSRKKRRVKSGGIPTMFAHQSGSRGSDGEDDHRDSSGNLHDVDDRDETLAEEMDEYFHTAPPTDDPDHSPAPHPPEQPNGELFTCDRCKKHIATVDRAEHDDFHFAQDLQNETMRPVPAPPKPASSSKPKAKGRGRPAANGIGAPEKGQRKLAFG